VEITRVHQTSSAHANLWFRFLPDRICTGPKLNPQVLAA
jgi:hypothetical protein